MRPPEPEDLWALAEQEARARSGREGQDMGGGS